MKQHYYDSSFREKLIEHLLIGELLKYSWKMGDCTLEISKPEVDRTGYDLVAECNGHIRHIQLKTSYRGSTTSKQKVHVNLAHKPSGCVLWVCFDQDSLELGPYLFFGGMPGKALPDISSLKVAKHTKGNAQGNKAERPNIREIKKSAFSELKSVKDLWNTLFVYPAITSVEDKGDYILSVFFDNGENGLLDMKPYLNFGVFKKIQAPGIFKSVHVKFDTIAWETGADLALEFVHKHCRR